MTRREGEGGGRRQGLQVVSRPNSIEHNNNHRLVCTSKSLIYRVQSQSQSTSFSKYRVGFKRREKSSGCSTSPTCACVPIKFIIYFKTIPCPPVLDRGPKGINQSLTCCTPTHTIHTHHNNTHYHNTTQHTQQRNNTQHTTYMTPTPVSTPTATSMQWWQKSPPLINRMSMNANADCMARLQGDGNMVVQVACKKMTC